MQAWKRNLRILSNFRSAPLTINCTVCLYLFMAVYLRLVLSSKL